LSFDFFYIWNLGLWQPELSISALPQSGGWRMKLQIPARSARSLLPEFGGSKALSSLKPARAADAQVRDEQIVKVLCFDLLSRERITEHLQRIREHHAAKLFYYEDSLKRHRENRTKHVRLGPLLTLHRGILAARAYVQWCDEALLLVAKVERKRRAALGLSRICLSRNDALSALLNSRQSTIRRPVPILLAQNRLDTYVR
jgi:Virulence activator alpha C-term